MTEGLTDVWYQDGLRELRRLEDEKPPRPSRPQRPTAPEGRKMGAYVMEEAELTPENALQQRNKAWLEVMNSNRVGSSTDWDLVMRDWESVTRENHMWDSFTPLTPQNWSKAFVDDERHAKRLMGNGEEGRGSILDRTVNPRDKFMETMAKAKALEGLRSGN